MGWQYGVFYYTKNILETIAFNYQDLYGDGLSFREGELETDLFSLAEFKADFDMALTYLGRGRWCGIIKDTNIRHYREFGRFQLAVIADILKASNYELEMMGYYDIPRLKQIAYYQMKIHLNGGDKNEP